MWTNNDVMMIGSMVGQINAFGDDKNDEIKIIREDFSDQGILKTWAIPIIPLLDSGCIRKLYEIWPKFSIGRTGDFFGELYHLSDQGDKNAIAVIREINEWKNRVVNSPRRLKRDLERARLYSWLLDQQLAMLFSESPISLLNHGIPELVERLSFALGLMNPFYNLEVIVGNPSLGLGVNHTLKSDTAGILDFVSFLLPAAFRDVITADCQNWNGLDWKLLRDQTKKLLGSDKIRGRIILNIAKLAGIPPHHVLFAANSLEWIPVRGGGKKDDPIPTQEALARLDEALLSTKGEADDIVSILSEINAHIRFLNWVPLIEGRLNFFGKNWTYASVCDTADQLFNTLCMNPEVWKDEFREIFEKDLALKLKNLDVASAKGRLLLHLIQNEDRLKSEYSGVNRLIASRAKNLIIGNREPIFLTEIQHPNQIGGKSFGLTLAATILPDQTLTDGFVLSSSDISSFLREKTSIWRNIIRIDKEKNIAEKVRIAEQIENLIICASIPEWLNNIINLGLDRFPRVNIWAIRSSSMDEGEARGVYQTILSVERKNILSAILRCLASYYSKNAVHFRMITGTGEIPDFAVLIQPYNHAQGGVASISDAKYTISVGSTPDKVTSGNEILEETSGKLGFDDRLSPVSLRVKNILEKLSGLFGNIQIEWFSRSENDIKLLQMEILPLSKKTSETINDPPVREIVMLSLDQISAVEKLLTKTDENISIKLNKKINLDSFHGEFLGLIARSGRRISKIQTSSPISPSSHFANICRYFGVQLV